MVASFTHKIHFAEKSRDRTSSNRRIAARPVVVAAVAISCQLKSSNLCPKQRSSPIIFNVRTHPSVHLLPQHISSTINTQLFHRNRRHKQSKHSLMQPDVMATEHTRLPNANMRIVFENERCVL